MLKPEVPNKAASELKKALMLRFDQVFKLTVVTKTAMLVISKG